MSNSPDKTSTSKADALQIMLAVLKRTLQNEAVWPFFSNSDYSNTLEVNRSLVKILLENEVTSQQLDQKLWKSLLSSVKNTLKFTVCVLEAVLQNGPLLDLIRGKEVYENAVVGNEALLESLRQNEEVKKDLTNDDWELLQNYPNLVQAGILPSLVITEEEVKAEEALPNEIKCTCSSKHKMLILKNCILLLTIFTIFTGIYLHEMEKLQTDIDGTKEEIVKISIVLKQINDDQKRIIQEECTSADYKQKAFFKKFKTVRKPAKARCDDIEIAECRKSNSDCAWNKTAETFSCQCPPPKTKYNHICVDVCEIKSNQDRCIERGAHCVRSNTVATCECDSPDLVWNDHSETCDESLKSFFTVTNGVYVGLCLLILSILAVCISKATGNFGRIKKKRK